ncbi:hypothetical protein ADN00_02860 [Ornatilinea apprima]|uniref:Uncharacterized protein n=1 Tax=Ornatilinea apprima TaxID=1134406 RepID=A0A0P6XVQ0_9CHLR|nr:hypothetical protein [Ornatilinea apprima]KPL79388.1 hypothetical protein ADN00_02860 [Ornatilinea apprima]
MNLSSIRSNQQLMQALRKFRVSPGLLFGIIIFTALIAFEMFNYSTTDYALRDLLGDLKFMGIHWATILTIAFCGIDFAGIARLFTPEQGNNEPKEVWYLFGAWLLAATMNAILTWWGVSMAIMTHNVQSAAVLDAETLIDVVPVFVAIMVWVIRILIIGSLSMAGDRLIWHQAARSPRRSTALENAQSAHNPARPSQRPMPSMPMTASSAPRPASRAMPRPVPGNSPVPEITPNRAEPTYHSVNMASSESSAPIGDRSAYTHTRQM